MQIYSCLCFCVYKAVPTVVDKTVVVPISTKKLTPMIPKIRTAQMFGKSVETLLSKKDRKNNKQNMVNIPVLIIGTRILASNNPKILLLFLRALNTKPATKPAIVVFKRQASTVPTGLIGINIARVDGENSAITPLKKPTTAPENGPHITAAKTMAIKDRLRLTGPRCK